MASNYKHTITLTFKTELRKPNIDKKIEQWLGDNGLVSVKTTAYSFVPLYHRQLVDAVLAVPEIAAATSTAPDIDQKVSDVVSTFLTENAVPISDLEV